MCIKEISHVIEFYPIAVSIFNSNTSFPGYMAVLFRQFIF